MLVYDAKPTNFLKSAEGEIDPIVLVISLYPSAFLEDTSQYVGLARGWVSDSSLSVPSAEVLDRIAPSLSAAGKLPKARRQMYADAQAEAEGMARAMRHNDSLGKPTPKKEMLRSLAALDAILMPFPAEVRGKVGGFMRLASLDAQIASGTPSQEAEQLAETERDLVLLTGD